MVLAEERSDVGGDRVDQADQLFGPGVAQIFAVGLVARQRELAQAPRQAALHQLALVGAEDDAGILADDVADEVELGVTELRSIMRGVGG